MNRYLKILTAVLLVSITAGSAAASPAELTIFPERSSTEINSFTSYEVEIENTGTVADVYRLSSTSSEVTIAPTRVPEDGVLEPGQSETFHVWYNPDQDKEAGVYSFTVTATSRATDKRYSVDATVEVIKDHDVSVHVRPSSQNACLDEKATYDVVVSNDGIQKEEFQLTTRYGKLSQQLVSLEEGENQTVTLTASASKPVQENFNVIAASTTSYAQDIKNVEFNSEICYASDISITPQKKDVAAFTEAEYEVTVRNTGTRDDQFTLSTNVGELDDTSLDIDGKSASSTTLTVTPEKLGQQALKVTAKSKVTSSGTATANVYNGMDMEVSFEQKKYNVCENERIDLEAEIENTGEAEETYSLSVLQGNLSDTEVELDPGENEEVDVEVDSSRMAEGRHRVQLTSTASTFDAPTRSANATVMVENCWDLQMNVVPKIQSAGKNRSVIYEIHLKNTGTRDNTYELSQEGPEWVSIKPETVEVAAGKTEKAFMYAGIPFGKDKAEIDIRASAVGNEVNTSDTVTLLIGKEVKEAIRSDRGGGLLTGLFDGRIPVRMPETGLGKAVLSIVVGLLITAGILYREW